MSGSRPPWPWPLALTALCACGPLADETELALPRATAGPATEMPIINGEPCGADLLAASAVIVVDGERQTSQGLVPVRKPICTGALIAPDTLLTASHCLDPAALTDGDGPMASVRYLVSFETDLAPLAAGDTDQLPADAVEAAATLLHPDYSLSAFNNVNGLGNYHDIALLFLSETFSSPTPALVITASEASQLQVGADVKIAGWGWQTINGPPPPGQVGVKVCADSFINEIGDHEMQIGDDSAPRKCHGDSGGPTFMRVSSSSPRRMRVVGVTSHTYDGSECARGSVDTRVDAWLDWLDATMRQACADGTRVWCDSPGLLPPPGGGEPEPEPEPGCRCSASTSQGGQLAVLMLLLGAARRRRQTKTDDRRPMTDDR